MKNIWLMKPLHLLSVMAIVAKMHSPSSFAQSQLKEGYVNCPQFDLVYNSARYASFSWWTICVSINLFNIFTDTARHLTPTGLHNLVFQTSPHVYRQYTHYDIPSLCNPHLTLPRVHWRLVLILWEELSLLLPKECMTLICCECLYLILITLPLPFSCLGKKKKMCIRDYQN